MNKLLAKEKTLEQILGEIQLDNEHLTDLQE
jgi:hypothetical protein